MRKKGEVCLICGEIKPIEDIEVDARDRAVCMDCVDDY